MTWILPAFAFLLPLMFSWVLYDTFDLPKLVLVFVLVTAGIVVMACRFFREKMPSLRWTGLELPLMVFWSVAALSTIQSIDPTLSGWGVYRVYTFGLWPMGAMILLFMLNVQFQSDIIRQRVLGAVILSGAFVGVYAGMQYVGIEIFDAMPRVEGGRPWSSLGNPIYVGTVCMISLLLTVGEWLKRRQAHALWGVLILAQSTGLVLSLSRSAWLGTAAGLMLCLGMAWKKKVSLMAALCLGAVLLIIPMTRSRVLSMVQPGESSNAARLEGWKAALHVWRDHPVLGSGTDTFIQAFRPYRNRAYLHAGGLSVTQAHAHNDVLQFASTMGGLGLGAWLLVLLVLAGLLRQASPPVIACVVAMVVHNQFNFSSITTSAWMAMLLGVTLPSRDVSLPESLYQRSGGKALVIGLLGGLVLVMVWGIAPRVLSDRAFRQAYIARSIGQPVAALVQVREAVRLSPKEETYLMEQSNIARSLAQIASEGTLRNDMLLEAWQASLSATRIHPSNPDAWNNLGVAAMWRVQMGKELSVREEARTAFEHAIALDPVFVDAWANLARWHHEAGDIPSEKAVWRNVLHLDPTHGMARQVLNVP